MMYVLVTGDAIAQVGPLPTVWFDGVRWWDFRDDATDPAALGWLHLVEEPRPADTPTTAWERTDPALVNGIPTVQWVERAKTPEELAAQAAQAEYDALRATVKAIVADLRAEKDRAQTVIDAANATINASPASYIKDTARASKRIADAAIDLARYVAP